MNEHGLSIGQESIRRGPRTRPEAAKLEVRRPLLLCYWVFRECLQRCRTTAEALGFIAQYDFASNVVLADAQGDIAAVEAVPGHKVVRRPGAAGAVACASAFASEEMIRVLAGAGFDHRAQPLYTTAIVRHQRLEAMATAARGRFTFDWLAALLRNHDGEPGTELCHQGNVCSTIAVAGERRFYVAARYPCRNEFVVYAV
jgi:predicted choloylglycine hydrolase